MQFSLQVLLGYRASEDSPTDEGNISFEEIAMYDGISTARGQLYNSKLSLDWLLFALIFSAHLLIRQSFLHEADNNAQMISCKSQR